MTDSISVSNELTSSSLSSSTVNGETELKAALPVMVAVSGGDATGRATQGRAFFTSSPTAGTTTLSSSGILLDPSSGLIITSPSAVLPFLSTTSPPSNPKKGTRFAVLAPTTDEPPASIPSGSQPVPPPGEPALPGSGWISASWIGWIHPTPAISAAVKALTRNDDSWSISWPASPSSSLSSRPLWVNDMSWLGRFALLRIPSLPKYLSTEPHALRIVSHESIPAQAMAPGAAVRVASSPFGLLSPEVFSNSTSKGVISNILKPSLAPENLPPPVYLTDARILPGSEGGPVLSESPSTPSALLGLASLPLRMDTIDLELSAVVSIHHILDAWSQQATSLGVEPPSLLSSQPQPSSSSSSSSSSPADPYPAISEALDSVVVLRIGSWWASGVIVHASEENLSIITSAHLLRPFIKDPSALRTISPLAPPSTASRSARTLRPSRPRNGSGPMRYTRPPGASRPRQRFPMTRGLGPGGLPSQPASGRSTTRARYTPAPSGWLNRRIVRNKVYRERKASGIPPVKRLSQYRAQASALGSKNPQTRSNVKYISLSSPLLVRLAGECTWNSGSVLYVGSDLDVALVQLPIKDRKLARPAKVMTVPAVLPPLPPPSQKAEVVGLGYGAFPPEHFEAPTRVIGLLSGVGYARVGRGSPIPKPPITKGEAAPLTQRVPVLLQSDAVVHQGHSGGPLLDASTGLFLGLITSHIRHLSGKAIPRLNFHIPSPLLYPLVAYVQTGNPAWITYLERLSVHVTRLWRLKPAGAKKAPPTRASL